MIGTGAGTPLSTFHICNNLLALYGTFVSITSTVGPVVDMRCENTLTALNPVAGISQVLVENPGGTFNLLLPPVLDVRYFGARCDGSTDDSSAFTTANNLRGINQIGISQGTCHLSNSVALTVGLYIGNLGQIDVATGKTLTLTYPLTVLTGTPVTTGSSVSVTAGCSCP